jgi:cytochrome c oxidase subunit IV
MSNATETHPEHDVTGHDAAHDHPSDLKYIKIAAILAALTTMEVLTYTFGMSGHALKAVVLPIMVVKFAIVAGFFMHLKFDSKMFTTMFVAGLTFAVIVYSVMLTTFRFW